MEHMILIGTEQIQNAASTMREAASKMRDAVGALEWALEQQRRWMDDWLQRFADTLRTPSPEPRDG